jgi:hypothetical protein
MKNLIIAVFTALILLGCASTESPGISTASIHFYFAPDPKYGAGTAVVETEHGTWTIEKAQVVFGEIGLHWDAPYTGGMLRMPRHDVDGQVRATVIIGHFAVDLLQSTKIQELQVEPRVFNHVHKVAFNSDTLATLQQSVRDIDNFPELKKGRTFFFSGEVTDLTGETRKFELYTVENFQENDFKSVLFDKKEIFQDDTYAFSLSPILDVWFATIRVSELHDTDGLIVISDFNPLNITNRGRFTTAFTAYHSMYLDIEQR